MARSDIILDRLLRLHPKVIDLSLERIERLLAALDHPERRLPPVVHVAGTNGKGSVIAYMRAALEAAGKLVHVYTSPHLVRFHERIRLAHGGGGRLIDEAALNAVLEECEAANEGQQITYFEITTAAAFLAFSRAPADVLLLEVGLGGRLDATNVVERPALSVITPIGLDHQQFLGEGMDDVAREKAGILKRDVPAVIAPQNALALETIEREAARRGAPLLIAGRDWEAFEQHGRLVYQDEAGLLDLTLPRLPGRHQIENAGTAIAALRALEVEGVGEQHIESGLQNAEWPARLQRLGPGRLFDYVPEETELWLDGGHNPAAGKAIAAAMAELEERVPRRLVLVCGMLNTKDSRAYLASFAGLAEQVITLTVPDEPNAIDAEELAETARIAGLEAAAAPDLETALALSADPWRGGARVLICGSLYLAGHVLAEHEG